MNENVNKKIAELKKLNEENLLETLIESREYLKIEKKLYEFHCKNDFSKVNEFLNAITELQKKEKYKVTFYTYFVVAERLYSLKKYEEALSYYYLAAYQSNSVLAIRNAAISKMKIIVVAHKEPEKISCIFIKKAEDQYEFMRTDTKQIIKLRFLENLSIKVKTLKPNDLVDVTAYKVLDKYYLFTEVNLKKREQKKIELANLLKEEARPATKVKEVDSDNLQKEEVRSVAKPIKVKRLYPYEGDLPFIFISYAHKDSEIVLPIIESLQKRGVRIWFDLGIEVGTEWSRDIGEHILKCSSFISLMSPNTEESRNCRSEIVLADKRKKDIIVAYLEDFELQDPGLELLLVRLHAIYLNRHETIDSFLDELCRAKSVLKCKE